VRLRMGDLSVKDTLVSAADGSFTSKKAFPRGNVLADVRRPAGDTAVDYEAYFDPSSDEAWVVSVPWPNFVRGRLVDGKGQPLASERGASDVEVRVFQDDADIEAIREEMTPKRSPDGGTFWFSGLNLGRCTVTVLRGFERHDFSTPVRRGPNELGDVVVPFRERVGPIHGRLTGPEHGGWGTLRLVEVATGITYETQARPDSSEFEFETVPRGNYRLTLYPRDGLRYAKPTRFLSPPATNIEFVAIGESDPVRFRPIDKESGQEIPLWNAWVLSSGRWCEVTACADAQKRHGNLEVTLEPSDIERWILAADGYRPAMGGAPDSARVDARLESGWGGAMFFVEGWGLLVKEQGRPLSGVEVLADGLPVALSDQDGAALLSLPRRPGLIEWDLPGWRRANAPEDAFSGSPLTMVRE